MANIKKINRVQDTDIKRLNHVGLGLKAIADQLGCHAATITLRLKAMGLSPTDTRRSFMEQVFLGLSRDEQDWLSHNLFNAGIGIKEFVITLIKEAYKQTPVVEAAVPAPMPEMLSVAPDDELETLVAVEPEYVEELEETPGAIPEPPKSLFGE
jgi:hypothetical protein